MNSLLDKAAGQRALHFQAPESRWSDDDAQGLTPAELLLYRSNLLGSDLTVTNFGGGNTSAKLVERDPLGAAEVAVLWVKGSGGDIGSMTLDGFSTLYLDKVLGLERLYRGLEHEDEMVGYLPHCTFNLNNRAASIDTALHAYLPFPHVDHVHPDAIIALAASRDGQSATKEIYGDDVAWMGWQRPGFDLGLRLRDLVAERPSLKGVMLAGHGVICWGADSQACYENTIDLIARAAGYLNIKLGHRPAFGGVRIKPLAPSVRAAAAASLMPRLRALMGGSRPMVGDFSDDPATLEFVGSHDFLRLAAVGTSCPDHFLRTKIAPLALDPTRLEDESHLSEAIQAYREAYKAYYLRNAGPLDPAMRDANPVVILVPGVGRFSFAGDKATARLAGEFYANAINVMRGAEVVGGYLGLPEAEAFAIEYWALEEAKLQRMPKPKGMAGRVALITGAAGGIGAAVAARLLNDGVCVMLTDFDPTALEVARADLAEQFGPDRVRATLCDVTRESQIESAFQAVTREFGGLDILVANAGLATSAPIEETTLEVWRRNYDVLVDGYFLASRAAFPLMRRQGGGAIVFVGSKNGLAATPNASAYASAKAATLHLARCLALEGANDGIRVNVVNPDAVLRGSKIWNGDWRKQRAGAYGIDPGNELEEFYRNRSMLRRDVYPEDVAEAVAFLISDAASKSTGNILNVDAGNAQAFTR
jgi:rhamnulose-1-phosphate aldolase/alcohol dehydrogenase